MQDDFDDIVNQWKKAKQRVPEGGAVDQLVKHAKSKQKASLAFHYGNMLVLAGVAVMLILFFIFLFPFKELMSRIGVALMVGGLVIRIMIEYYSALKSRTIDVSNNALSNTDQTLDFYNFRKRIHGPVTIIIVAIYCIGLGLLTPEFYKYIGPVIFLFDGMFCVAGVIIIWQVRKGIRKEMTDLKDILEIRRQLTQI